MLHNSCAVSSPARARSPTVAEVAPLLGTPPSHSQGEGQFHVSAGEAGVPSRVVTRESV